MRLLRPLGYRLIWYGAGNAAYVHRSAYDLLGSSWRCRIVWRGLPELEPKACYASSVVMAMWPSGRTMRRWFYEVGRLCSWPAAEEPPNASLAEAQAALAELLKGKPFTLSL